MRNTRIIILTLALCCVLLAGAAGCRERPSAWKELKPGGDLPTARFCHCMVYDSVTGGRMLLFGGQDDKGECDDTWAYDLAANTWTELDPAGEVPSARSGHCMVFTDLGRMVLFGGVGSLPADLFNDTWAYDPNDNAWTELDPAGDVPSARRGHSMVYDPAHGKVILFGGEERFATDLLNDTWAYDPSDNTWTELDPTGEVPFARSGHSMVYDPVHGKMILFGGFGGRSFLSDTWAYDPSDNTWTELKPSGSVPVPRGDHSMVYDLDSSKAVLFGGSGPETVFNDTWAYDPGPNRWTHDFGANTWTELYPVGETPPARRYHSIVYDPISRRAILFGGDGEAYADLLNDTWAWDPKP